MERPSASSPEKVPSPDAVPAVSATVEAQLRTLLRLEAATQRHALEERRRKAIEAGTHDPKERQKMGWAEQLQQSARSRIELAMQQRGASESETLNDATVAAMLKGIVENGKLGKMDMPSEVRKTIADFCARHGTPEHWWPAALRAVWCLDLGRSLGMTKKPEGPDLLPETRSFLGGLEYEFRKVKAERHIGVEGRARATPQDVRNGIQSDNPIRQDTAIRLLDETLEGWVTHAPKQPEARSEHFAEVMKTLDVVADHPRFVNMDPEKRVPISRRMSVTRDRVARKTGAA